MVLNVHEYRCDALALVSGLDDVMHIPLDSLSYETVRALHREFNRLFLTDTDSRLMRSMRLTTSATSAEFANVLSVLWSRIAKPGLDCLALTVIHLILDLTV